MKYFLVLFSLFFIVACQQSDNKNNEGGAAKASTDTVNYTTIKWLDSLKVLGTLKMGENAEINYRFTNSGTKPLYIISAQPGCGCTIADYPKEAIMPGQEGVIKAGFDTQKSSVGAFHKNIIVVTNTRYNVNHNLFFSGEIVSDSAANNNKPSPTFKDSNTL